MSSWVNRDARLTENEWNLLQFSTLESEAFVISKSNETSPNKDQPPSQLNSSSSIQQSWSLLSESDWYEWLNKEPLGPKSEVSTGVNLVMAGRASQSSELSKLPFTRETFAHIKDELKVHGSIVRAINRNTSCSVSMFPFSWREEETTTPSIVYNCRTPETWEGDMALSITFFPDTLITNAVWYGCNLSKHNVDGYSLTDCEIITTRLSSFDGAIYHPMLLPTIFADFERNRQIRLARASLDSMIQKVFDNAYMEPQLDEITRRNTAISLAGRETHDENLQGLTFTNLKNKMGNIFSQDGQSHKSDSIDMGEKQPVAQPPMLTVNKEPHVVPWLENGYLKNGLENWRAQLLRMIDHVDELDQTSFGMTDTSSCEKELAALRESGAIIRGRLRELVNEYDEFIREITNVMEAMNLAVQLELHNASRRDTLINQEISTTSLQVAEMTRNDGSLMKSIAILGMVFLPSTFVSTCFSMGFFQWRTADSKTHVSPDVWVFVVVALVVTLITLVVFCVFHLRRRRGMQKGSTVFAV